MNACTYPVGSPTLAHRARTYFLGKFSLRNLSANSFMTETKGRISINKNFIFSYLKAEGNGTRFRRALLRLLLFQCMLCCSCNNKRRLKKRYFNFLRRLSESNVCISRIARDAARCCTYYKSNESLASLPSYSLIETKVKKYLKIISSKFHVQECQIDEELNIIHWKPGTRRLTLYKLQLLTNSRTSI